MKIKTWVKRHPVLAYFVLAYAITWGGILLVTAPILTAGGTLPPTVFGLVFLAMLAGPSIAGLSMTAGVDGRRGLHDLATRMRRWRLPLRWYAVATLTVPAATLAVLVPLAVFIAPVYTPAFQVIGVVIGLLAGFFEEIGWTGFALPKLQARHGWLVSGLMLGVLWALWHILANYVGTMSLPPALLWSSFLFFCLPVIAYRVLMTWVYTHTQSVLLAQLMHACYTGTLVALGPATSVPQTLVWEAFFTLLLWLAVVMVVRQCQQSAQRLEQSTAALTHKERYI